MTLLKGSTYLALIISSTLLYDAAVDSQLVGAALWRRGPPLAAVLVFFSGAWRLRIFARPGAPLRAREPFRVRRSACVAIWQLVELLTLHLVLRGPELRAGVGWLVGLRGDASSQRHRSCSKLSGVKRTPSAVETLWMVQRYLRRRACRTRYWLSLTSISRPLGLLVGLVAWALALVLSFNGSATAPIHRCDLPCSASYRLSDWGIVASGLR